MNGAGTLLTTTDCLLNKNRNPSLSKSQIEIHLKDYYGQKQICWLTGGIDGDDTDGHIDDLARFISPTQIVIGMEDDRRMSNFKVLKSASESNWKSCAIRMVGVLRLSKFRCPASSSMTASACPRRM